MDQRGFLITEDSSLENALVQDFQDKGNSLKIIASAQKIEEETACWLPQVIIIDSSASAKESLKICRTLKQSRQFGEIPLIFLAGSMSPQQMKAAYKAGADYYVLNQGEDRRALNLTIQSILSLRTRISVA